MIARDFPYGSVILSMTFTEINSTTELKEGNLTIVFKKKVGVQSRVYSEVPRTHAYKMYYEQKPKEIMSYYSNNIKGQYKVLTVINK